MGRKSWLAVAAVLGVTYLTSPYVALFRLSQDLRAGDLDAVQADIDWARVRAGMKQDIAEQFTGVKVTAIAQSDALPPFGASFVQGVASHMVDETVTPEGLCAAMHGGGGVIRADALRGWGMFEGATSFVAHLHPAGSQPMMLQMRLEGTEWKVTGVHLEPQSRT